MKKYFLMLATAGFLLACNNSNSDADGDNSRENPSDSMYPMRDDPHAGQPSDTSRSDTSYRDTMQHQR